MSRKGTCAVLFLVASVSLLAVAASSAGPQNEEYSFGEVVEVERVNVEVWVTDQQGNPVIGLTAEDFEVFEDGQPVTITNFTEVGVEARLPSATAPSPISEPPSMSEVLPAVEPPGHWVFYFDQLHMNAGNQQRLIDDVRGFLELSSIPAERVLILRQDESLYTEASFGSTRAELDAVLETLARSGSPKGQMAALEKRLTLDRLQQMWDTIRNQSINTERVQGREPCEVFPFQAITEVNRFTRESTARISTTVESLRTVASFLAGVPGVKTLVYAGDFLETHPGDDLVRFIRDLCPAERETARFGLPEGLGPAFRELTRDANANRVTVYTLQTSGLRSNPLQAADQPTLSAGSLPAANTVMGQSIRTSERSGLEYLALETGGRAVLNTNEFELALDNISQDMSSYYSLAYEPPHRGDGLEHQIKVRVQGKEFNTRHRLNYRHKSSEERMADRLKSALYLGVSSNPLAVRLGAGELIMVDPERYQLRLHLMVPAEGVAFLPQEDQLVARLKAEVATQNLENSKVEMEETSFRVQQPPTADEATLDLIVTLELERGIYTVAVALRDEATSETSYVSTSISIQPPAAAPETGTGF